MVMERLKIVGILAGVASLLACHGPSDSSPKGARPVPEAPPVTASRPSAPGFDAAAAYRTLDSFLRLGPRVPGTQAHAAARDFIKERIRPYADAVEVQAVRVRRFDGRELPAYNIMAEFKGESPRALLLMTHWDSRYVADYDSVRRDAPILGADDGGSGAAVLLALAPILADHPPPITIRMLFLDAEDQGAPPWVTNAPPHSYCLGAQAWAAQRRPDQYFADYGILLDMVGGRDARFLQEGWSRQFAGRYVSKIWTLAQSLGLSPPFTALPTDPVTDDHYYIATQGGIPSLNIINYDHRRPRRFPWYWHTHADTLGNIDTLTLDAVGTLLLHLIYTHNGFLDGS